MDTLEEVLNGKEPEAVEEVVEKAAEETEPTGEEVEDETKEASPAPETESQVPLSAMHGERDRRQAAERENAELRSKLEVSEKPEPTSVFDDENKFRNEVESTFDQKLVNQNLNQSEFFAAREIGRGELDSKISIFKDLVDKNPELSNRFANAVSPYHELIDIVNQYDELDKLSDLDSYKAKLKAEARAEVKTELEKEQDDKAKLRESIPNSLVGDTSQGSLTSKDWSGPPKAEDLYG